MKRFLSLFFAFVLSFSLVSCSHIGETKDANAIVQAMLEYGLPIKNIIVYNEDTDPNSKLGRKNQYTSKVNFADARVEQFDNENPVGGTVEVFNNRKDAEDRKEYVEAVSFFGVQYMYLEDTALLRIDTELTPTQAAEYEKVFKSVMNGEPAPSSSSSSEISSYDESSKASKADSSEIVSANSDLSSKPINDIDFFRITKNREAYSEYIRAFDFEGLKSYVENFIAEDEHVPENSAYIVLDTMNQLIELKQGLEVIYDDFEEVYTLQHPDVTKISKSISVVPKIEESSLKITYGFRKSDWLFFDDIDIKCPDGTIESVYCGNDTETDVISGGIEEYYTESLSIIPDGYLLDGDFTIRFSNRDTEETYDHQLSKSEVIALTSMCKIQNALDMLDELKYENK